MAKKERVTLRLTARDKAFLWVLAISNGKSLNAELTRLLRAEMETRPDIMKALRAVENQ